MLSKRRSRLWLFAGLLCVGGCFCWLIAARNRAHYPFYEGKPLTYWFNQLPMTHLQGGEVQVCTRKSARHIGSGVVQRYGTWIEDPDASAKAIRAKGTNGCKLYLAKVGRHDGPLRNLARGKIQQAVFALGVRHFLFEDVTAEREQAVTALILLKPLPSWALDAVTMLSTNRDAEIARAARCILLTEPAKLRLPPASDEPVRRLLESSPWEVTRIPRIDTN